MSKVLEAPRSIVERNNLLSQMNYDLVEMRNMKDNEIIDMLTEKLNMMDRIEENNDLIICSCVIDLLNEIIEERVRK